MYLLPVGTSVLLTCTSMVQPVLAARSRPHAAECVPTTVAAAAARRPTVHSAMAAAASAVVCVAASVANSAAAFG